MTQSSHAFVQKVHILPTSKPGRGEGGSRRLYDADGLANGPISLTYRLARRLLVRP